MRVGGQGDGDHGALAHAARKLVRIAVDPLFGRGDAHQFQQLHGAAVQLAPIQGGVFAQGLANLLAHRQHRIERADGLLEDHADLAAADVAQLVVAERHQLPILPADAAFHHARRTDEAHDGAQGDALARAAFADQAEHLAGEEVKADAVHRGQEAPRRVKGGAQVAYAQNRLRVVFGGGCR